MKPLTPRQKEVVAFIRLYIEKHGRPPTVREIADGLGVRSTNTVSDHLKLIEKKGVIVREPLKSRAIRLVG